MKKGIELLKAIQKKNKGSQNYSSNIEEDIQLLIQNQSLTLVLLKLIIMTQDINILFRKVYNRGDKWYAICASNLPEEDITYILNIPVGRQQVFDEDGLRIFRINKDWAIIKWEYTKEFYFVYLHKGFIVCRYESLTTGETGLDIFKVA